MNYTQAQIDRANAVSLEDFLRTQGETLIKSGREYRWKEHDEISRLNLHHQALLRCTVVHIHACPAQQDIVDSQLKALFLENDLPLLKLPLLTLYHRFRSLHWFFPIVPYGVISVNEESRGAGYSAGVPAEAVDKAARLAIKVRKGV